jgi:hypothetical protein
MMSDPVAAFIRAEKDELVQAAPAPHAARLWHTARQRRAASLQRVMRASAWLARLILAAAMVAGFLLVRPEAYFLAILCAVAIWLTRGACAPAQARSVKDS